MISFYSKVFHGDKEGRQIGFPTINLDPKVIPSDTKEGVYSSDVTISGKNFSGALYFGPRTIRNEVTNVLEIFILDFDQEIYGEIVKFSLKKFIRPVIHFTSLSELQVQLKSDISMVKKEYENN